MLCRWGDAGAVRGAAAPATRLLGRARPPPPPPPTHTHTHTHTTTTTTHHYEMFGWGTRTSGVGCGAALPEYPKRFSMPLDRFFAPRARLAGPDVRWACLAGQREAPGGPPGLCISSCDVIANQRAAR